MKYIVYLTTNISNNKIYVGVHQTENPDKFDGYLGCAVNIYKPSTYKKSKTPFQYAVNKYGVDSFRRNTLYIFDNREDAFKLEAFIVDEEFVKRKDTYNVALGGGIIPLTNKITYQYDLEGNFIKEWESSAEIARVNAISSSSITNAINYKTTSMESLWSYEKYTKLDITGYTIYNINKTIYKYDLSGNLVVTYISITDSANSNNTTTSNIQRAIKGEYKINNHYYSLLLLNNFVPKEKVSIKNKKLYAYSESGIFVKEYNSPSEAVKELGIKSSSAITTSIRTGRCCANYQWSLEKVPFMKEIILTKSKKVKIAQYSLSGEFIKEFDTITQVKNEFGSGVQKAIDGKCKSYKNYIFKKLN